MAGGSCPKIRKRIRAMNKQTAERAIFSVIPDYYNYLKVKLLGLSDLHFKIKRTTQLKKLMIAYCERQSVDLDSIAFFYEGRRLQEEQTPHELNMFDGDEIDAMLLPTHGAFSA